MAAGVIRTTAGRFGKALVFNGINGIVNIPSTASLDLTAAFTLEAWVSPSASGRLAHRPHERLGHGPHIRAVFEFGYHGTGGPRANELGPYRDSGGAAAVEHLDAHSRGL